jgi:hypothetical protein
VADITLRSVGADLILTDTVRDAAPAATVITLINEDPRPSVDLGQFTLVLGNVGSDIILRDTALPAVTPYILRVKLRDDVIVSFPTQFSGLRYFHGSIKELCLVAVADAPLPVWRVRKGATTYAVYLVDTTDPNASTVRIRTASGTKAARLKT